MPVEYPPTLRWSASEIPKRRAASATRDSHEARVHLEERGRVLEVVGTGQAVVQGGAGGHHAAPATDLGALGIDFGVEPQRADGAAVANAARR